jgi:hypothetical protein
VRAPGERHAGNTKTDRVICSITEKIQRIGLKRRRSCSSARNNFCHEEPGIDDERDPQRAPPCGAVERFGAGI